MLNLNCLTQRKEREPERRERFLRRLISVGLSGQAGSMRRGAFSLGVFGGQEFFGLLWFRGIFEQQVMHDEK